jgi:hypothetical protein
MFETEFLKYRIHVAVALPAIEAGKHIYLRLFVFRTFAFFAIFCSNSPEAGVSEEVKAAGPVG